jgi:flagellar protein FlaG
MSSEMIIQPGIQVRGQGTTQVSQGNDRPEMIPTINQRKEMASTGQNLPQQTEHESKTVATKLDAIVSQMSGYIQNQHRELQFKIDKDSGRTMITVLNSDTREVIRQIPHERALQLVNSLENDEGLIFQELA